MWIRAYRYALRLILHHLSHQGRNMHMSQTCHFGNIRHLTFLQCMCTWCCENTQDLPIANFNYIINITTEVSMLTIRLPRSNIHVANGRISFLWSWVIFHYIYTYITLFLSLFSPCQAGCWICFLASYWTQAMGVKAQNPNHRAAGEFFMSHFLYSAFHKRAFWWFPCMVMVNNASVNTECVYLFKIVVWFLSDIYSKWSCWIIW